MTTIWKYPLRIQDVQDIEMPEGAQILSLQTQGGVPMLWVKVVETAKLEARRLFIFGTGHPIVDDGLGFIGTVQTNNGALVWHIFEQAK